MTRRTPHKDWRRKPREQRPVVGNWTTLRDKHRKRHNPRYIAELRKGPGALRGGKLEELLQERPMQDIKINDIMDLIGSAENSSYMRVSLISRVLKIYKTALHSHPETFKLIEDVYKLHYFAARSYEDMGNELRSEAKFLRSNEKNTQSKGKYVNAIIAYEGVVEHRLESIKFIERRLAEGNYTPKKYISLCLARADSYKAMGRATMKIRRIRSQIKEDKPLKWQVEEFDDKALEYYEAILKCEKFSEITFNQRLSLCESYNSLLGNLLGKARYNLIHCDDPTKIDSLKKKIGFYESRLDYLDALKTSKPTSSE